MPAERFSFTVSVFWENADVEILFLYLHLILHRIIILASYIGPLTLTLILVR